ncbi:hypothetical protein LCGC14_2862060, partial [marine sediment metagenome]
MRIPFWPVEDAAAFADADPDVWLDRTVQYWKGALSKAAHIEVPCRKATEALLAAHVCQLIANDHGEVHGGEGFYDFFFIRDGAYQVMELEEADRGLRIKGRLLIEQGVPTADKVFALLKAGALDALSIGFMVPNNGAVFDREAGVRVLKKIDLMEISIVTFPMNPKAKIQRVKALAAEGIETKRDFENYLREAGFSA